MDSNQYNQNNANTPKSGTGNYNSSNYNPNNYDSNSYNSNGNNPGQPPYQNYYQKRPYDPNNEPMTLKDWVLTLLLLLIPIANLVLCFVWAFGDNVNRSKKTFFQAYLIFMLVYIVLSVIIAIAIISFGAVFFANTYRYY